jgi:hypothetical protein
LARKQGALDDQSKFQHSSALWKGILDVRLLEQTFYHRDVEVSSFVLSERSTCLIMQGISASTIKLYGGVEV